MKTFLNAALLLALVPAIVRAQINAGEQKPESSLPFTMTQVATFNLPWRMAFLPDGRMLVTEKVGPIWLVTQEGEKTQVGSLVHQRQRLRRSAERPQQLRLLRHGLPERPVWYRHLR